MGLPDDVDPSAFDRFRRDVERWRPPVAALCARHGVSAEPFVPFRDGSNLVAAVGDRHVVKVFPSFHRDQWESERRVLPRVRERLPVEVPALVAAWEWLLWVVIS